MAVSLSCFREVDGFSAITRWRYFPIHPNYFSREDKLLWFFFKIVEKNILKKTKVTRLLGRSN